MGQKVILCVDDEPDALEAIGFGLKDRGFRVLTALSGGEALDILKKETPDLILADLRMQPMNGFELIQAIKKKEKLKQVPVLILTAVNEPMAQKYGEKLGADAYITKPVDLDDLIAAINNKLAGA